MFPLVLCLNTTEEETFHCKFAVNGIEETVKFFYVIYFVKVNYIIIFLFQQAGDIKNRSGRQHGSMVGEITAGHF